MPPLHEHPLDPATARAVRLFLGRLAAYPVRRAILFGSRARGGFRPDSDADVAVVLTAGAVNAQEPRP